MDNPANPHMNSYPEIKIDMLQPSVSACQKMSLLMLFENIVRWSSYRALNEVLERKAVDGDKRLMEYIDFIAYNMHRTIGNHRNAFEIIETARNLTADKFSMLPASNKDLRVRPKGYRTDCRLYYKVLINRANRSFAKKPPKKELEKEARTSSIFRLFVRRQFKFSILESFRKSKRFWSRYCWKINGRRIYLWLPSHINGQQCLEWLERNFERLDPNKPLARQRIQEIINHEFGGYKYISLDEELPVESGADRLYWSKLDEQDGIRLTEIIAAEKAADIDKQRPAIRKIGPERLEQMISKIFEGLRQGEYLDAKIARTFSISKASFSRFAGKRWSSGSENIPDLWRNTARVIAKHEVFREMARKAGVWDKVKSATGE